MFLPSPCTGKIRSVGGGRYEAYMIPPARSNHASFLELNPSNGALLMAWFSGTSEGDNNCSIVVAYSTKNSSQWSSSTLASRQNGFSNQNPVLYYDTHLSKFRLYHSHQKAKIGRGRGEKRRGGGEEGMRKTTEGGRGDFVGSYENTSRIWTCESEDQLGRKWTEPEELMNEAGSFDRNRIVQSLRPNTLIFPIYYARTLS